MLRVSVFVLVSACAATSFAAPPTLEVLGQQLALDGNAIAELREGKTFQRFPQEVSDRDIAAGVAFIAKQAPSEVAKRFFQFTDVAVNPSVRATHDVTTAADFASLSLGRYGDDEVKRFVAAKPDEINLSPDEETAFRTLPSTREAIEEQLRKLLTNRWNAYRARGLAGIEPYARDDGKLLHGDEELRAVTQKSLSKLVAYVGPAREALDAYPKHDPHLREAFRWIVYEDDKRPRVTLRHRMMYTLDDGNVVFSDREIYVSQGYNQMQGYAGSFLVDGASTLFLYRANTSTDRVGGSASSMKHSIGRKMLVKQLASIFDRFREKLGK